MKALLITALMAMAGVAHADCSVRAWSAMYHVNEDSYLLRYADIIKEQVDSLKSCIGNQSTDYSMKKYSNEDIQRGIDFYEAAYTKQKAKEDAAEAESQRRIKAYEAEQSRLAKLPGVRVGMSANDVLTKSSWGRPNSVNRTTTAFGTHEQWVYGGRNYLYFDNGRLTAVQN